MKGKIGETGIMDVKISSYNVHSCVGNDGIYSVDRIASVVRDGNADIVCLQEIEVLNDIAIQTRVWSVRHNEPNIMYFHPLYGV